MSAAANGIDAAAVAEIAQTYGLDAGKLGERLRHLVSGGYEVAELLAHQPGAKDAKKLLDRLKKQASDLKETIGNIPIDSLLHADLFHKYTNLYVLCNKELPDLIEAVGSIRPKDKRGVSADTLKRDMLIKHIARFWHQQRGERPTYSTDRDSNDRRGAFLTFLSEVAVLLHVDPAPLPDRFAYLTKNRAIPYK